MSKVAGYVIAGLAVCGTLVGLFDILAFGLKLITRYAWTAGSYHQPVLTALYVFGGATCALLVPLLGIAAVLRSDQRKATAVMTVPLLAGAVTGLWLPFIHVGEVDVDGSGFRQDRYVTTTGLALTFYDAASVPVTVCLGIHGACGAGVEPDRLKAPGVTLRPGQRVVVSFPEAGRYPITIVTPIVGMSAIDTVVESSLTYCQEHPESQTCICGSNGC